jgi:glycogen synthase
MACFWFGYMVKVLFVTAFDLSEHSGSHVATRSLIRALGSREHIALTLLAPVPSNGSDLSSALPVARWEPLPPRTRWSVWWHLTTAVRVWWRLRQIVRAWEPDIVAVRHAIYFVPAAFLFPRRKQKLVLLIRGSLKVPLGISGPVGDLLENVTRLVSLRVADRADRVLFAYRDAIGDEGRRLSRAVIRVVPNGADVGVFPVVSKEEARNQLDSVGRGRLAGKVVGFAGSLRSRHCLEELLHSSGILHRSGLDHRLLIVGNGPVRPALETLAAELGIRDFVRFVGRVPHEEVGLCLAACDLLYGVVDPTNPSNPIKVYEGLAAGRPVITSAKPELQFVEDHAFGALVTSIDPPKIAAAIKAGLSMPWTEGDAARARDYISEHHSWDTLASEVLEVAKVQAPGLPERDLRSGEGVC